MPRELCVGERVSWKHNGAYWTGNIQSIEKYSYTIVNCTKNGILTHDVWMLRKNGISY